MLTDTHCRNATCPEAVKRKRLSDSHGLYLEVTPNRAKRWFWKFYFASKESRLALGSYPAVSLKEARAKRDEARKLRAAGTNPVIKRKADKASSAANDSTFAAVAREFHALRAPGWSEKYASRWLDCMKKDVFPWIGSMQMTEITAPVLLGVLRRVVKRGALETAHSLRQWSGQAFRYGITIGKCDRDTAADLAGALPTLNVRNVSAIVTPERAGELMRAMEIYSGQPTTRICMQMSALLFQRPGNMRTMEWSEIDVHSATWSIPAAKMKRTVKQKQNGRPHFVPLPAQALALLEEVRPLTGHGRFVFPAMTREGRSLSENTIRVALRSLGFNNDEHTPHGFRAMARTLLVERLGVPDGVIEAQLAHSKSGPLGSAYDRAEFIEQRRRMMQSWADYLDQLRDGAKVIPM
jgi:integrase